MTLAVIWWAEQTMNRHEDTQRSVLEAFDRRPQLEGKGSRRFSGDVCCRILREFLAPEMGPSFGLSEPNAYVGGYPCEFDLLIVTDRARPIQYTNAYDPACVSAELR